MCSTKAHSTEVAKLLFKGLMFPQPFNFYFIYFINKSKQRFSCLFVTFSLTANFGFLLILYRTNNKTWKKVVSECGTSAYQELLWEIIRKCRSIGQLICHAHLWEATELKDWLSCLNWQAKNHLRKWMSNYSSDFSLTPDVKMQQSCSSLPEIHINLNCLLAGMIVH